MAGLAAVGGMVGGAGVVTAAVAVFLSGPPVLVRAARALGVLGLVIGGVGLVQELVANGFAMEPMRRGEGMAQGSLFAAAGMLLLTFGAARVADRRHAARSRARFLEEQRRKREGESTR